MKLKLLWDSVSKDFDFVFLFDCLLVNGDKNLLQRSEELFPFSPLFVGGRVAYLCVAWSLKSSPTI